MATIFIVDDGQAIGEMLSLVFGKQRIPYRYLHGRTACGRCSPTVKPDSILLDVMLPGLDGTEVARRIRQTSNVPRLNLYSRFSLRRLLRHGRAEVRRSLQARTVALAVILTLAVAIVFSGVSITSVCASLLNQITQQSRNDYSNMVQQTQTSLDAADVSSTVQVQQLVNDLASSLQSIGSPHDSIVISDIKAS